jgi:hypothetical protein
MQLVVIENFGGGGIELCPSIAAMQFLAHDIAPDIVFVIQLASLETPVYVYISYLTTKTKAVNI